MQEDKGHFKVSKVILNKNKNQYPLNDFKVGGMSELSVKLKTKNKQEGELFIKGIQTDKFKYIIDATS